MASLSTSDEILYVVQEYNLYTSCVIFIAGILGNSVNILVFTSLKIFRQNQCVLYLTTEYVANLIQVIVYFFLRIFPAASGIDPASYSVGWCKLRSMLITTCSLISYSAICFAAADQYLSTSHRINLRKVSTVKLSQCLVFGAVCISTLHSIPFAIFYGIWPSIGCAVLNPGMSNYISSFYYPVLSGILPISFASMFSLLAFRNVRRIVRRQVPIVRRRLDQQLTAMILMRVIFFVVLTLPNTVQRIYSYNATITKANPMPYAINAAVSAITGSLFNLNYAVRSLSDIFIIYINYFLYRHLSISLWLHQHDIAVK
jgi:hypothetical protein